MASNTKDFIVNILADTKRFLLNGAEKQLDDLGDSAKHTGKNLDALGKDTDAAGKDVKDFGHDAEATAKKVDSAFDKIASSSKSNLRGIKDDTEHAKKGLHDFKDEAHSSGKEAAASFSGSFDDVTSTVQEIAANAFGGFGAMGAAAGLAAAAGLGFIMTKMNEAKAAIKEVTGLIIDSGGKVNNSTVLTQLRKFADDGTINDLAAQARTAKVDVNDYMLAMAGDPAALARVRSETAAYHDEVAKGGPIALEDKAAWDKRDHAISQVDFALKKTERTYGLAQQAADRYTAASSGAAKADEAAAAAADKNKVARETVAGVMTSSADATDALSQKIQEAAQAEADATKSTSDSWTDHAKTVKLTAKDIISVLNEQATEAEAFQANLLVVQQRGDNDFTSWVAQQPANVAAAYKAGNAKERQGIYDSYKRLFGQAAGSGIAAGMTESEAIINSAAAGIHAGVAAKLGVPITIPTIIGNPPAAQVALVANAILSGMGTLVIPTTLGTPGATGSSRRDRWQSETRKSG